MQKRLIECVPNFSEGQDMNVINQITAEIESVDGVELLDVDPGKATNRTVVTFVGEPDPVIEAAFRAIKKAAELIDMAKHEGEHPRMGATDVCPLIPVSNISMDEVVACSKILAERVGRELNIPVYLYENSASNPRRQNLATIRAGEYEGFAEKIQKPDWKPDYGPDTFNVKAGSTAIGARDFLIAYNVNLNTTSVKRANAVAFDVREQGRIKREGHPVTGKIVEDREGNPVRIPGTCKSVKGIGWFIEEYGIAQVSMNLTNIRDSSLHMVFEACCKSADSRGLRVTGSELIGLVPLQVMLDAGKYFLKKQQRSLGAPDEEIIKIAVKSMGLDELSPFDPSKKIIEYRMKKESDEYLVRKNLIQFSDETASESPAPGGGSIAAYTGSLGAALSAMVANLSAAKTGWEDQFEYFSDIAEKAQTLKKNLLFLVDEDTRSFNAILEAFRLPKTSPDEITIRKQAIQDATKYAIEVPLQVLKTAYAIFELAHDMVLKGNPNSVTDAAVAALCARAAVKGAYLNVMINTGSYQDKVFVGKVLAEAADLSARADQLESKILEDCHRIIESQ